MARVHAYSESFYILGKCPHVECLEGNWGEWNRIPEDTCLTHTRKRQMIRTYNLVERASNCNGVQTTCPEAEEESRRWCKYNQEYQKVYLYLLDG